MKKILQFLGIKKKENQNIPSPVQIQIPVKNSAVMGDVTSFNGQQNKKVGISFAITVHNEGATYLEPLFQKLIQHIGPEDEIIVLDDFSEEASTVATLQKYKSYFTLVQKALDGNFGEHKNYLKSLCKKDYILQIDADELLHTSFFAAIKNVLKTYSQVDLFHVPRINIVDGLTEEDIQRWQWNVNEKGWVNSPDYQARLFRNIPEIKWIGKLHESITGHKTFASLPFEDETYSLIHRKDIDRQRKQDEFYKTMI